MSGRTIPLAFGLIGALALSQFPEFVQQYTQRVGGAYEELAAEAGQFRTNAELGGQTTEEALSTLEHGGGVVAEQAASVRHLLAREADLGALYSGLQDEEGFNKIYAFLRYPQPELIRQTAEIYRPAAPLSFDGAAYAALGFLTFYLSLRLPQILLFRGRRRRAGAGRPRQGKVAAQRQMA